MKAFTFRHPILLMNIYNIIYQKVKNEEMEVW